MRPYERSGAGVTVTPILLLALLTLLCHSCLGSTRDEDGTSPRILTVLTTYHERTRFIKAYREAAAAREDGLDPLIFVTSDEEDMDPDGVIDYRFGEPSHHRLLAAISEATSRYEGQFDWIAAGDDDTVFMYRRAMAFLRHIDPTQPIALGITHGLCPKDTGQIRGQCECFTPEEKRNLSWTRARDGCCLDFTRPCAVSIRPEIGSSEQANAKFIRGGLTAVYDGNFFWPYGGTGFFMSVGLAVRIQGTGIGWDRCREMFAGLNTDMQVGRCLIAHGFTMSDFHEGFYRPHIATREGIEGYLASNCQIIGVHAGIRHLGGGQEYTTDKFTTALSAVWEEDKAEWTADESLRNECPQAWEALSMWK